MISSQEAQQMQMTGLQSMQMQQQFAQNQIFGYQMQGHNLPNNGFSFKNPEIGYGDGNAAGMAAVGSLNNVYKAGSFAVGAMGAAAGYKAGGAMGALRGAAMAGGPLLGAGMAFGGHAFGNMLEGAQEQNSMQQMLGQNHQFINGGSRTGRGFSRQDTKAISDFTRELSSLPELMTSFGELRNIMEKVAQSGAMNGVRNAQEYQRRMRETITTLKDVSKIMATTMEESIKFFAESKQSGLYSPQMIKMNAMQRQFTAGITGMNQDQIGQLQMAGANTSTATGGFRGSGAQAALRSARQLGMANEMGLISDERIMEMTGGIGGAQGIQAVAGGLTNAAQTMAQGSMGTAMSIALGKQDKSGRFTGAIDEELAEKVRMGGISKEQLLSMAHKKTSSQVAKISFKSQENKLRSEMASRVGVEGMGMELQDILGGAGWQNPDAVNLVMQRYGLDEKTAKMVQEMGNALPSIQRELGSKAQTEGRRMAEQSYMKENMSTDAIKNKLLKRLENTFSEPFKKMGGDLSNLVSGYVEETMDSFLGRYSTNVTRQTSNLASGSLGGNKTSQVEMASLLSGAKGLNLRPGMTKTDSMGDAFIATLTGQSSSNSDKFRFLEGLSAKGMATPVIKSGMFGGVAGYSQDASKISAAKQYLGNLQAGKGAVGLSADDAGSMASLRKDIGNVLREHGTAMKDMTQAERISFIRGKVGGLTSDLAYLEKKGITIEEIISEVQHKEGLSTHLGAVNFNKYASELYGTGDFGGAEQMSVAEKTSRNQLAAAFGDQQSNVISLLAGDSKGRDLFLSAASGNLKDSADARKLLTQEMSMEEREVLSKKFGVTADQSLHLAGIYGGAQGKDVSKLAQASMGDINKSSLAGLAAQLRRQGIDIGDRLGRSGLSGGAADSISRLAGNLSGLGSVDKLGKFLGGEGAGQIDAALSAVSGLTGKDRERGLAALGEGATSAIGYGDYVARQAQRGKGLGFKELQGKLSEDEYAWAKEHAHGGSLSRKDAEELGRMARNRAYAGGLSGAGTVSAKEGNAQKEYLENLNRFAQTTAQFAELVIQATPQLAENVKKAKDAIRQSDNIVPRSPNMSIP